SGATIPGTARSRGGLRPAWGSFRPPVLLDLRDFRTQRLQLVVGPVFLLQQGADGLAARASEEHAHQVADGFLLRGGARRGGQVDVAEPLGAVPDEPLGFELD